MKIYSKQEIKESERLLIIIDDHVFDLTSYKHLHPGGEEILLKVKGIDATKEFNDNHVDDGYVSNMLFKLCVGKVNDNN